MSKRGEADEEDLEDMRDDDQRFGGKKEIDRARDELTKKVLNPKLKEVVAKPLVLRTVVIILYPCV